MMLIHIVARVSGSQGPRKQNGPKSKDEHIEAGKNGRHFPDDIFQCIFLNEDIGISIKFFTEVCSQGSNWQYPSIGSVNGLAPSRRQAIIWTNDGCITDAYMRHSASMI